MFKTWKEISLSITSAAVLLSGCAEGRREPVGGGTAMSAVAFSGLYATNTDHGTVARVDLDKGTVTEINIGREPTRIARSGAQLYVTLRGERAIGVARETGEGLELIDKIPTEAEPYGIAVIGGRAYVAASTANKVQEIDLVTKETLRSWSIEGEPRWVVAHPSGRSLYVGSAFGGRLSRVDLSTGRVERLTLPTLRGFDFTRGPSGEIVLSQRITGDLTVTPDGKHLALPVLYVNNVSEIDDSAAENIDLSDTTTDPHDPPTGMEPDPGPNTSPTDPKPTEPDRPGMGGPGGGYDTGRFDPTVVVMDLDQGDGRVPSGTQAEAIEVGGFAIMPNGQGKQVTGYLSSVVATPDSELLLATIEGAASAVAIKLDNSNGCAGGVGLPRGGSVNGASCRSIQLVSTPAGPRGLAITPSNRVFVHGFFDRKVAEIDLSEVRAGLNNTDPGKAFGQMLSSRDELVIAPQVLSDEVEAGRRLFFATNDTRMSSDGSAVSCGTCHFDGRNDGLTWNFTRGRRQTPSLANGGQFAKMSPVGWAGKVETVAHEALQTSQGRMGGAGLVLREARKIEAFVLHNRDVDVMKPADQSAIERGREIFNSPEVACGSCHSGERYTDNKVYAMPQLGIDLVKTRPLVGIAVTGPYFHDGSARTLRDVLERSKNGSMGDTSGLNAEQLDDLETFLKSL